MKLLIKIFFSFYLIQQALFPDFIEDKNKYLSYQKKQKEISEVFKTTPIERRIYFKIDVPSYIFNPLFDDLDLAVKKAVQYARVKYRSQFLKEKEAYDCHDGKKTAALIYPILKNNEENHYLFYVKGRYNSNIKINGSMIIDISFSKKDNHTIFDIKVYIRLSNPFLRGFSKIFTNNKYLKKFSNQLINNSIKGIKRVGFKVGRGILREKKKKC